MPAGLPIQSQQQIFRIGILAHFAPIFPFLSTHSSILQRLIHNCLNPANIFMFKVNNNVVIDVVLVYLHLNILVYLVFGTELVKPSKYFHVNNVVIDVVLVYLYLKVLVYLH